MTANAWKAQLKARKRRQKCLPAHDILDDVDIAFYGEYKELSEDDKAVLRDMVRVMRDRRAKKKQEE